MENTKKDPATLCIAIEQKEEPITIARDHYIRLLFTQANMEFLRECYLKTDTNYELTLPLVALFGKRPEKEKQEVKNGAE